MKRSLYLILILILIMLLSGCLPKVPDKITGPTWTSRYQQIPLFQRTKNKGGVIYFKDGKPGEDSKDVYLGLDELNTDLAFTFESEEPINVNLMSEQPTIELGSIDSISFDHIPGSEGNFDIGMLGWKLISISLAGTKAEDYFDLTLSEDYPDYNYISVTLVGATAGDNGLSIILYEGNPNEGGSEIARASLVKSEHTKKLYFNGKTFDPGKGLSIGLDGDLYYDGGGTLEVKFDPRPLKVASFSVDKDKFDNLTDDFPDEDVESTIELPEALKDFQLELKKASLTFNLQQESIKNIEITTVLTLIACDDKGTELDSFIKEITLPSSQALDLLDGDTNLNTILKKQPHQIKLKMAKPDVKATGDVNVTFPANITIGYNMDLTTESLTHSSSDGIKTGDFKVPDNLPVDFVSGAISFDINNTSPARLKIDLWLSSDPPPYIDGPNCTLAVGDGSTESSLTLDQDLYNELKNSNTFYYQLKVTNQGKENTKFGDNDYLEITAWMDIEFKVNSR